MISAPSQRQSRAITAFELSPVLAGAFAVVVGVLVMIGWWRDIEALRTIVPGLIPMIPNTALACILGGLGAIAATLSERYLRFREIARAFAFALTALGLAFFIERAAKINLGIDLLLFGDRLRTSEWLPPGRPAVNSAIIMILDGVALLLADYRTIRGRRPT
jgi:hypothetical protein